MIILITLLSATLINSSNVTKHTNENTSLITIDFESCNGKYLFNYKLETSLFTKTICYRRKNLYLISYYEYIRLNTTLKSLNCAKLLKKRCGIAENDIVGWMNTQKTKKECIEVYFKEEFVNNSQHYERMCYVNSKTRFDVELSELPFCNLHYNYYAANHSFNLSQPITENAKIT